MKKTLSIIIALVCLGTAVNAQTLVKFETTLTSPANNGTITSAVPFNSNAIVKVTQGAVGPTDTIYFQDYVLANLATPSNRYKTGRTLAVNDTVQFTNNSFTLTGGASTTFDYCAISILFSSTGPGGLSPKFDTTGGTWRDCNSINYVNMNTGIGEILAAENGLQTQKFNVYPNPAIGNEINVDYIAQNNSEVVATVYDLTGRKVLSHNYGKAHKGQEGFGLDISALNSGMYIMELRQDGIKATGQFVK